MLFLGLGGVAANEKSTDDEASDIVEELVDDSWMQLLIKEEDVYSLRPWAQVKNARKSDLAKALRAYMRQAWSK